MKIQAFADKINNSTIILPFHNDIISVLGKSLIPLIISTSLYASNNIGSSDTQFSISDKTQIKQVKEIDILKKDMEILFLMKKYNLEDSFEENNGSIKLREIAKMYMNKYGILSLEEAIEAYAKDNNKIDTNYKAYLSSTNFFNIIEESMIDINKYYTMFIDKAKSKNKNLIIDKDNMYLYLAYYINLENTIKILNDNNKDLKEGKLEYKDLDLLMNNYSHLKFEYNILVNINEKIKSNLMNKIYLLEDDKVKFIMENESSILLLKTLGENKFNEFNIEKLKKDALILNELIVNTALSFPDEISYQSYFSLSQDIEISMIEYEKEYIDIIKMYLNNNEIDKRILETKLKNSINIKNKDLEILDIE